MFFLPPNNLFVKDFQHYGVLKLNFGAQDVFKLILYSIFSTYQSWLLAAAEILSQELRLAKLSEDNLLFNVAL